MELLAISKFLLTVTFATAFNVRELRNDTSQQQLFIPVIQENEAGHYSRITNGFEAAPDKFPYQVGLKIWYNERFNSICGGSLIKEEWVLTAAHCLRNGIHASVYLGSIVFEAPQQSFHRIAKRYMIEHHAFNYTTRHNDIGLIKTPRIKFREGISSVGLPQRNSPIRIGAYAFFAGWGTTSDSTNRYSPVLLYHQFKIISNEKCAEDFQPTKIHREQICVETSNKISGCLGDSGGPLVLVGTNTQIGINSFGWSLGCEHGKPTVFTRVEYYLDWIHEMYEKYKYNRIP